MNAVFVDHGKFLQRVRVLRVSDVTNDVKDLLLQCLVAARLARLSLKDFDAGIGVVETVAVHHWRAESRCNSNKMMRGLFSRGVFFRLIQIASGV